MRGELKITPARISRFPFLVGEVFPRCRVFLRYEMLFVYGVLASCGLLLRYRQLLSSGIDSCLMGCYYTIESYHAIFRYFTLWLVLTRWDDVLLWDAVYQVYAIGCDRVHYGMFLRFGVSKRCVMLLSMILTYRNSLPCGML